MKITAEEARALFEPYKMEELLKSAYDKIRTSASYSDSAYILLTNRSYSVSDEVVKILESQGFEAKILDFSCSNYLEIKW